MKNRFFPVIVLFFLVLSMELYASGRREEPEEADPVNPEYILCITAPDVSALPTDRQIMGNLVLRVLIENLEGIDYRFRSDEEVGFYQDYAWAKARNEAARNLALRRNERDLLLYRGDPSWRHRKNLKALEETIKRLEEEFAIIDAQAPLVEEKPVLMLSETNRAGNFPAAPEDGGENLFLNSQKADAFLSLSLSEYHGRTYLGLRMYTFHTNSFSFEDSVLFSSEDLLEGLDEIGSRLASTLTGTLPSMLLVHASPPDAMVLVDNKFAGIGTAEVFTHSPGEVEVEVRAENHVPSRFPLELNPGEAAEVSVSLTPLGFSVYSIEVPGSPGARVYLGNLYLGEAPLSLTLPRHRFSYVNVETPDLETATGIFVNDDLMRGRADFVRTDGGGQVSFQTRVPVSPEENRVERARRRFYRTYGVFWIVLPLSLLTAGVAANYILANNYVTAGAPFDGDYDKLHSDALKASNIQRWANVAWISGLSLSLFQAFRYLYVSRNDAEPNVRAAETRTEE